VVVVDPVVVDVIGVVVLVVITVVVLIVLVVVVVCLVVLVVGLLVVVERVVVVVGLIVVVLVVVAPGIEQTILFTLTPSLFAVESLVNLNFILTVLNEDISIVFKPSSPLSLYLTLLFPSYMVKKSYFCSVYCSIVTAPTV